MYLLSVNSSNPSCPPSRPMPDCLTPPNGAAGSDTMPRVTPTLPAPTASPTPRAPQRGGQVGGVQVGDKAVPGVVGPADDVCLIAEPPPGRHRPEDLGAEDGRVRGHIAEHGRQVEEAAPVGRLPAGHHPRAAD